MADDNSTAPTSQHYGKPLTVTVRDGQLVIAIGIRTLAHAVAFSDWSTPYDDREGDYFRTFAIENPEQFAKDVALAMQREEENGATPLSDFLDEMSQAAIDDGSTGIADIECQIRNGQFHPVESWSKQD